MKVAVCELPNGTIVGDHQWRALVEMANAARPSLLILNEMPFGDWVAVTADFDKDVPAAFRADHDISCLDQFGDVSVVASRPIEVRSGKLVNEGFVWERQNIRALHQKHYFPEEPGFFERIWFDADELGFDIAMIDGIGVGILLCTELMFTERARHYGRSGASLIAVPRAARGTSIEKWKTAAGMAALVSGCYVASSNRAGPLDTTASFGGGGFIFGPNGKLIVETCPARDCGVGSRLGAPLPEKLSLLCRRGRRTACAAEERRTVTRTQ